LGEKSLPTGLGEPGDRQLGEAQAGPESHREALLEGFTVQSIAVLPLSLLKSGLGALNYNLQ
jgi:hypothetical protein